MEKSETQTTEREYEARLAHALAVEYAIENGGRDTEPWDDLPERWREMWRYVAEGMRNYHTEHIERLRDAIGNALKLMVNPYDGAEFEDGEVPAVDVLRAALRDAK